jgi:hypothetical protein
MNKDELELVKQIAKLYAEAAVEDREYRHSDYSGMSMLRAEEAADELWEAAQANKGSDIDQAIYGFAKNLVEAEKDALLRHSIQVAPDYQEFSCGRQLAWEVDGVVYHNAIYLHGELESLAGYDIVYGLFGEEPKTIKLDSSDDDPLVTVHIQPKGTDVMVKKLGRLVWWLAENRHGSPWLKGLIVGVDDTTALQYAQTARELRSIDT